MTQRNHDLPPFRLIVPAAGRGSRFGASLPKQFHLLHGKTVLCHTLERFHKLKSCLEIYIAIGADDADKVHETVKDLPNVRIVTGGKSRKESVFNALSSISDAKDEDIILIHDAARPCLPLTDIHALLKALKTARAATLAAPVSATLRRSDANQTALETVEREHLWAVQTPQAFRYNDLIRAHENAPDMQSTDDSQLVSALGIPVKLIKGSPQNIKITMNEDLETAAKIIAPQCEVRIGQGFDVHAFDTGKSGPLRLCGIDVEHPCALKGHSDADVGLHTLTDAIYGALGAGDIGIHFPPSDNTFKDMDSAHFLKHAIDLMHQRGAKLINTDITIICERPKIGPHADAMKRRIADICAVDPARINVKATTTEKLGFTGRGEGIAAQAVVSISYPTESSV